MDELADQLRQCLPAMVAVGVADAHEVHIAFDGEFLPDASPSRLVEFRGGRAAARRAMQAFGEAPLAIPVAPDRSPIWPSGIVGSISHCDGFCAALVARADQIRGVGLDVEPIRDLPQEVWDVVLRPEELNFIQRLDSAIQGSTALACFVAKEAVYKAQYPISKQLFDFQTLRIQISEQRFSAEFTADVPYFNRGTVFAGQFVSSDRFLAAFTILT